MTDRALTLRGSVYPTRTEEKGHEWGDVPAFHIAEGRIFTWGYLPYLTRFFSPSSRSLGNLGSMPKCREIPVAYDDAGVDFPGSGYVQVLAGMPLARTDVPSVTQFLTAGTTTRTAVSSPRHWLFPTVVIGGIPPGTTGTITISRATDWTTGVSDAEVLFTISVDGADGIAQTFEVAERISAPADLPPISRFIYVTASWSGTAPRTGFLSHSPPNLHTGPIVPTSLPGDFEARTESDWQRTYDFGMQYAPYKSPFDFIPGDWSPYWLQFTRNYSSGTEAIQSLESGNRPCRVAMGFPDWLLESANQGDATTPANEALQKVIPRAWIGNELKQLAYWTRSHGLKAWTVYSLAKTLFSAGGTQATFDSGWIEANTGPGWRNVRAQMYNDLSDYPDITLDELTVEIRMDSVSQGTMDFTSDTMTGAAGKQRDIADIYPASRTMASLLEYRIVMKATSATSGSIRISIYIGLSPRIDIPIPTHTGGVDGIEAPGGYFATGLIDPPALGGIYHAGAGVTSYAWTITVGTGVTQWRMISFLPATTGLYKITINAINVTSGMYEFGLNPQTSALAQAGKRFFGKFAGSDAQMNGTWTLAPVTMTPKSIDTGGTTIADGDLSPATDGYLFGEIAIPSAGTWRIWGRWIGATSRVATSTIEMAVSLTDPYCIDAIDDSAYILPWYPLGNIPALTSASTPPGSPSHGTLRFITATATGVWAGKEGSLARYDENVGWQIITPTETDRIFATIDGTQKYFNGETWEVTATMRNIELTVTTDAAQTVYVRANQFDKNSLTFYNANSPKASGATLVIGWEAA